MAPVCASSRRAPEVNSQHLGTTGGSGDARGEEDGGWMLDGCGMEPEGLVMCF